MIRYEMPVIDIRTRRFISIALRCFLRHIIFAATTLRHTPRAEIRRLISLSGLLYAEMPPCLRRH